MKLRITKVIVTTAVMIVFTLAAPNAFAQQDVKGKPTASGQMKEGGKEVGKAGKSLGRNVRRGRIVRGGKHFGKHMGHAGRHVGRGTKRAVKKAGKP
jgi:hypothetical protein